MLRIKLDTNKLVGYMPTNLTQTGITKLGTAKLGCVEKKFPAETPTTKSLPIRPDDRE
jgi:hypothetical protein